MARRWHFWYCFQGPDREKKAQAAIKYIKRKYGFPAKVWAPLPRHQTSGHTHVVFLCSDDEFSRLLWKGREFNRFGQRTKQKGDRHLRTLAKSYPCSIRPASVVIPALKALQEVRPTPKISMTPCIKILLSEGSCQ